MDYTLEDGHVKISVFKSYKLLWKILKLPNIRVLAIALLTMKVNILNNKLQFIFISKLLLFFI